MSLALCSANPALADLLPLGESVNTSRFSDEKIQLLAPSDTGNRPPLIYESGDDFLGRGEVQEGFTTPWGAVWQPQFWVFGTLRTGVYYFDVPRVRGAPSAEWATRLSLFANLQLTHTEKIIIEELKKAKPNYYFLSKKGDLKEAAKNLYSTCLLYTSDAADE